jgi:hypothetical protein
MAESIGISIREPDEYDKIEDQKAILRNILSEKHHPLIYLDNYETISYELNDKSKSPITKCCEY